MDAQTALDLIMLQDEDPEILKKLASEIHGTLEAHDFISFVRWTYPEHFKRFIVDDNLSPGKMWAFDPNSTIIFNPKTMIFMSGPRRE